MSGGPPIDLASCHHVLVVKPSSLGDIVHTLPAVRGLKQAFPDTEFHWVVNEAWAPLLDDNPDISSRIIFPRKNLRGLSAPTQFLRWCRKERRAHGEGFDAALDFQGLLRSALIAQGLRAKTIIGLSDAREGASHFYKHVADVSTTPHAVDRYLALAKLVGGRASQEFPLPKGTPVDGLTPDTLRNSVLVHPWSRGKGKSLTPAFVDRLTEALSPRPVVVVGVHPEGPQLDHDHATDLTNATTLPQLLWLLRHAGAVVSVDSGPMHLAAALPVPLLGLHSWSDPRKVGPWRPDAYVWKSDRIVTTAQLDLLPHPEAPSSDWPFELVDEIATWVDTVFQKSENAPPR